MSALLLTTPSPVLEEDPPPTRVPMDLGGSGMPPELPETLGLEAQVEDEERGGLG